MNASNATIAAAAIAAAVAVFIALFTYMKVTRPAVEQTAGQALLMAVQALSEDRKEELVRVEARAVHLELRATQLEAQSRAAESRDELCRSELAALREALRKSGVVVVVPP